MRTRSAIEARLLEIENEVERLNKFDSPTRSQDMQRNQLEAESVELLTEFDQIRRADVGLAARNPDNTESGAFVPQPVQVMRRTNPWQGGSDDLRGRALGAIERCQRLPDRAREVATRNVENDDDKSRALAAWTVASSNPAYFTAFRSWVNDPTTGSHGWSPEERDAFRQVSELSRAMSIGVAGSGGFLVPYELDPAIVISSAGSVNPMRELARIEQTVANEKRFVTSTGVVSSWDAEAAEVSDDSPALLQPTITTHKGAGYIQLSYELNEDSNLGAQVGALFADSKAQLEANAFTLGTGTGQPKGIVTAVSAVAGSVMATGTNALGTSDLFNAQAALPARWRANARWMMNLSVINGYRQLPQASGLNFAVVDDAGPVPRALGWTVAENSAMKGLPLTATASDFTVVVGDFSQYVVVDRLGATIVPVPVVVGANRRPTGERGFYLHWRAGGDALVPDAFRLVNHNG